MGTQKIVLASGSPRRREPVSYTHLAHQRVTDVGHVDADLVGAAGFKSALGVGIARCV